MQPFAIGLWTEKDIDMFHYNAKQYALMGDATGSIAAKVGTKMIYCSFLLHDKTRNSEPLANIEILTDSHDELPIRHCLNQFILDEKSHNSNTVPVLFTCDISWPILKSAILCFNNESVEEYLSRSYRISNGRASSSDLHIKPSKLFLHFCLSHMMHAFSRRLGKYITGRKKRFIMYCCSILANSEKWSIFRKNIYSIFILLLSCYKTDKKQRVDSIVVDLKLKKISSHRLYEINTSRITKSPKLASENYNKKKKRKFTYQKPLPDDSKLKNFFQDSPSDNKSVSKK